MERRRKVELFEELRREYEYGCGTIVGVAKRFGVHRRLVRQAIESALPPERKRAARRRPKFVAICEFIDQRLKEDEQAPRKQRHTAHRIYERLRVELPGVRVSERTVRQYVRERRAQLGLYERVVMVPQAYEWGVEAQVDWYEAVVVLGGTRQTVQCFAMRAMASGAAFHCAYPRATQQAFLEAHELAFAYFGGVFRRLRYDNLSSAVKKIVRGYRREETTRFIAFRSHWQYEASFCNPAQGHEKGGVEGEVGRFRRNHLVPVPAFADFAELNAYLLTACQQDEGRRIAAHELTVGADLAIERQQLRPLAREGFALAEESYGVVDAKGCIRARLNSYSTPLSPGQRPLVRVLPATIEVWQQGQRVARHERSYERGQQILDLEHYLDVLARKPGALAGSKPLQQWRAEGRWTRAYDELWESLQQRHGVADGTREMIAVLQLGRRCGYVRLSAAIAEALACGACDTAAVSYLLSAPALVAPSPALLLVDDETGSSLAAAYFTRPLPSLTSYDSLLERNTVTVGPAAEVAL